MKTRGYRITAYPLLGVLLLLALRPVGAVECRDVESASLQDCLIADGWEKAKSESGISVYSRGDSGSNIREVLATARMRAPAQAILATLVDFNHYTDFMPNTLERCEQLANDGDDYWVFQQLKLPVVSDRYYTIRLRVNQKSSQPGDYVLKWTLADEPSYQRKGHGQRVSFNNGYWSLREQSDGTTQVIYYIHTDPGSLWRWVVDLANREAVPDVVNAVKRRVEKTNRN